MIRSTPRHAVPEPLLLAMQAAGSSVARAALAEPRDRVAAAKHAQLVERTAGGTAGRTEVDARPPPRRGCPK